MYYMFDSTYILVIIGGLLAMWASNHVRSTFAKYDELDTENGITGKEAAEIILNRTHIQDVRVEAVQGNLTDHYDPRNKVLRLSQATYGSRSVAAVAVAAHECGHAVQDAEGYLMLRLRASLVPVVNIGSSLAIPLILIGMLFQITGLVTAGIVAFAFVLLFQLVTLPVEFDASKRALEILEHEQVFQAEELPDAESVLRAAAFTYVAASISTALQLLRLIMISRRND